MLLGYQLPVFGVFGLVVLDRYRRRNDFSWRHGLIDGLVTLIGASRTLTWFLPLSGHALFLTYAVGTVVDNCVRAIALLVLVEAIAFKHFWLYDDSTPWVGLFAGLAAILLRRFVGRTDH